MFHIVIFLHIGLKQQYFVSLLQMFCQNCGADISNSGAKFRRSCRTELNSITKSNTSTGGQSLTICDSFQSFIKFKRKDRLEAPKTKVKKKAKKEESVKVREICNEHRSVICHNKLIV